MTIYTPSAQDELEPIFVDSNPLSVKIFGTESGEKTAARFFLRPAFEANRDIALSYRSDTGSAYRSFVESRHAESNLLVTPVCTSGSAMFQWSAYQRRWWWPSRNWLVSDFLLVDRPEEVKAFLIENKDVLVTFIKSLPHISRYFGAAFQIELDVTVINEDDNSKELIAYIVCSLSPEEALARLNEFDQEWFLDQLDEVGERFNFSVITK